MRPRGAQSTGVKRRYHFGRVRANVRKPNVPEYEDAWRTVLLLLPLSLRAEGRKEPLFQLV